MSVCESAAAYFASAFITTLVAFTGVARHGTVVYSTLHMLVRARHKRSGLAWLGLALPRLCSDFTVFFNLNTPRLRPWHVLGVFKKSGGVFWQKSKLRPGSLLLPGSTIHLSTGLGTGRKGWQQFHGEAVRSTSLSAERDLLVWDTVRTSASSGLYGPSRHWKGSEKECICTCKQF